MRLDHPSYDKLIEMNKKFPYVKIVHPDIPCDVYFYAKQKRLPFPNSIHKFVDIFELVHMNIWGSLYIPSINGHKYFLTIVDDKTIFTWIFFMKCKYETSTLREFVSMVHAQFKTKIKCIRSNSDNKFLLRDFYSENDIFHKSSYISTPQ